MAHEPQIMAIEPPLLCHMTHFYWGWDGLQYIDSHTNKDVAAQRHTHPSTVKKKHAKGG